VDTERLTSLIRTNPRGIIVCGPHAGSELSTVRYAWPSATGLIDAYDLFLREPRLTSQLIPDLILRVGAMPTSKPLVQFLGRQEAPTVAIEPGNLRDAGHAVTWHLAADEVATMNGVASALASGGNPASSGWLRSWQGLNARTRHSVDPMIGGCTTLSEPAIAANLVNVMPSGGTLVVGNSMPVRDVDTFAAGGNRGIRVTGTRGASGIDGVTSTALGVASVASGPVALLIGDLSFLHDLGGLQAATYARTSLVIVVVNNDGGGIFSFLPQHTQIDTQTFELLFGTPTAVDIHGAANLFGCAYSRPDSLQEFRDAVSRGFAAPGVMIVEVRTNRAENLALHREIAAAVLSDLAEVTVA
jgi:2-succinyl-5-enolpyruvyl-6-hydroxy-3-cyclohexene-1-carboxylate synthase